MGALFETSKETHARIKARTKAIKVGGTYFLSSFYDKDGAIVKIISTSTKVNKCGWPSTVEYKVIEAVGDQSTRRYYTDGKEGTCNASNLYENRVDASAARKFAHKRS